MAARRITNRRLAQLTGRTEAWVSKVINGYAPVTDDFAERVAAVLGLPADALFHNGEQGGSQVITIESDLAAFIEASRLSQGLPPRVTDAATLGKVAAILAAGSRQEAV
jgi:transcriptional regulator with XRE-family HTH domain